MGWCLLLTYCEEQKGDVQSQSYSALRPQDFVLGILAQPLSALLAVPAWDLFSTRLQGSTLKPWSCLPPLVVPIIHRTVSCSYIRSIMIHLLLAFSSPTSCPSFRWHFISQPSRVPCPSWPFSLEAPSMWHALLPSQHPLTPTSRINLADLPQCLSFPLSPG